MADLPGTWALYDGVAQTEPLDEGHVLRMISAGLPENTLGRREGTSEWVSLRTHAPFAMAFERRAVAPAAVTGASFNSAAPTRGEVVFAEENGLQITNTRAVFGAATYPMANITSVRMYVEPRPPLLALVTVGLLGLGVLCVVGGSTPGSIVFLAFGAVAAALYFAAFRDRYWVRIGTAGTEANAFECADVEHARRLVQALEQAIISRG